MKRTTLCLGASICASVVASAVPHFHSEFDEASIGDITGLTVDTPKTSGADSGTVTLDTASQRLDLTANGANLWTAREGAPIAWVASPTVAVGQTWFVETQITHTDSTGNNSTYDQAGITFYSGTAGNNPGSENTGIHQSLFVGISDWNQWHHRVQGFADNNPNVSVAASGGDDTFEYRVEVTENGASDTYNFFYREDPADAWTQYGPTDLSQDFDNSAVGLFIKSNNANTTASTEFDYLTVDVIASLDTDADGLDDNWEIANTTAPGNLTDLTGLKAGPGPGPDSGDFDGDGLTDLEEFDLAVTTVTYPGISPILADTDADGRNDFDEVNGTTGPPAIGATDPTDPDSDGDGLHDGAETNTGTFVSYDSGTNTGDTGTDPTTANSDADDLEDGFEVTNNGDGYDPNVDDSASDFDGDASTVAEEIAAGTDVLLPDTDGDGFYDGAETNTGSFISYDYTTNTGDTGTDPLDDDSDDDGLLDGVESGTDTFVDANDTGTDPTVVDSDGDGYGDGLEVTNATDPTDDTSIPPFPAGYAETGGDWLTKGDNDIDGDGRLGTDGFFFAGQETSPGVFNGVQNGNTGSFDGVGTLPSYVTEITGGTDVVGTAFAFPAYGLIDDPLLLDGTDASGGFWIATGGAAGDSLENVKFTVAGLPAGVTVRVGVLGGVEGTADGRWDATSITLSDGTNSATIGDHVFNPLPASPGGTNAGWGFFDIDSNGTYTVSVTKRVDTQGAGIGGLTFDSFGEAIALGIASIGSDLQFSWASTSGKVYDILRSTDPEADGDPSTWAVWQGDLEADASGTNTEMFGRPTEPVSLFALLEKDAPPIYAESFDGVTAPNLPAGWVVGGTSGTPATAWALGTPDSTGFTGPSAAFSGDNCVGTNLSAVYGPDAAVTLTSPAVTVPAETATLLRFRQVVEIDGMTAGGADFGTLRLLNAIDDTELEVLEAAVEGTTAGGWTLYAVSIPAQPVELSVKLEFGLTTDSSTGAPDGFERAGWYIDDVEVFEE